MVFILVKKAIVFIDDSNFYHNIKKVGLRSSWINLLKLCEFICSKFNVEHFKTYYYCSVPSISDGKDMYYKQIKYLDDIDNLPKFETRRRKLQRLSTKEIIAKQKEILKTLSLCDKCLLEVEKGFIDSVGRIQRKEKGVDVMMAVEMISCTIKKECDACIVISGDSDFLPAMDLVKENGAQIISAFIKCDGYSTEIRKKHQFLYLTRKIFIDCIKPEKKDMIKQFL